MQARQTVGKWIVLLAWLPLALAACAGGSGSSGFDAAPQSENVAIAEVLEQQHCVTHETLQICPVGTPPTDTTYRPHVGTGLDGATAVACAPSAGNGACGFVLPFMADGFSAATTFRVAVRTVNPDGPWRLTDTLPPSGASNAPEFDVPVSVEGSSSAPPPSEQVQVAVLAFLQPPTSVPVQVEDLGDSGADFAFVTNELAVEFAGSTAD